MFRLDAYELASYFYVPSSKTEGRQERGSTTVGQEVGQSVGKSSFAETIGLTALETGVSMRATYIW